MAYSPYLTDLIEQHRLYHESCKEVSKEFNDMTKYIPNGQSIELEIRACSIYVVGKVVENIKLKGVETNAILVDFYLWDFVKRIESSVNINIHRTRSIYY